MFELLKMFLTESGTFIGLRPDEESKKIITEFIGRYDLKDPVKSDKLHCTLAYSKTEIEPKLKDGPYQATVSSVERLGPDEDEKALVLMLDSSDLHDRFDWIHDNTDAHYAYGEYKPHVTVEYDTKISDEELEKMNCDLADSDPTSIVLVNEYAEELKEGEHTP